MVTSETYPCLAVQGHPCKPLVSGGMRMATAKCTRCGLIQSILTWIREGIRPATHWPFEERKLDQLMGDLPR